MQFIPEEVIRYASVAMPKSKNFRTLVRNVDKVRARGGKPLILSDDKYVYMCVIEIVT